MDIPHGTYKSIENCYAGKSVFVTGGTGFLGKKMDIPHETYKSIENCYAGKSVFVTGGTGFLGKVLVEKLLYSCPQIDKIYFLIREKKKCDAMDRMNQIFNLPIFQRLQKERPEDLKKVIPIIGDLILPNLGICEENQKTLTEEVSFVFHCAADVKFNQSLKTAMNVNYEGTRSMLQLCQRMKHIEAFIYVSTAYSHTDQPTLEEVIYSPPASIDGVYKIIEQETGDGKLRSELLSSRPNTYTFTKALTEALVNDEHDKVPSIIIRPSIVSASLNEPVMGWVDNWFGATGLMHLVAKGLNRLVLSKRSNIIDLIPVDYVSNLIIVAATRPNGSKDPLVYHSCSGSVNALTMGKLSDIVVEDSIKHKSSEILQPMLIFLQSQLLLKFLAFNIETIPAFLADCCLRLLRKPPRYMKIKSKVTQIRDALQFFTSHSWIIKCSRTRELFASLSSIDQAKFGFDPNNILWEAYIPTHLTGIKSFLLNKKVQT